MSDEEKKRNSKIQMVEVPLYIDTDLVEIKQGIPMRDVEGPTLVLSVTKIFGNDRYPVKGFWAKTDPLEWHWILANGDDSELILIKRYLPLAQQEAQGGILTIGQEREMNRKTEEHERKQREELTQRELSFLEDFLITHTTLETRSSLEGDLLEKISRLVRESRTHLDPKTSIGFKEPLP